jgi:hypothetical protein
MTKTRNKGSFFCSYKDNIFKGFFQQKKTDEKNLKGSLQFEGDNNLIRTCLVARNGSVNVLLFDFFCLKKKKNFLIHFFATVVLVFRWKKQQKMKKEGMKPK